MVTYKELTESLILTIIKVLDQKEGNIEEAPPTTSDDQ